MVQVGEVEDGNGLHFHSFDSPKLAEGESKLSLIWALQGSVGYEEKC